MKNEAEKKTAEVGRTSVTPVFQQRKAGLVAEEDEDELRAQSEVARNMFNFPAERIWSWSRWRKREINLIASEMTRLAATDPNRPKDDNGRPKPLALILLEWMGWLRLGEEGAMRNEGMGIFQVQKEAEMKGDVWSDKGSGLG